MGGLGLLFRRQSISIGRTTQRRRRRRRRLFLCALPRLENGLAHIVSLDGDRQGRRQVIEDELLRLVFVAHQDVAGDGVELFFYVGQEDEFFFVRGNVGELVVEVVDVDAVRRVV